MQIDFFCVLIKYFCLHFFFFLGFEKKYLYIIFITLFFFVACLTYGQQFAGNLLLDFLHIVDRTIFVFKTQPKEKTGFAILKTQWLFLKVVNPGYLFIFPLLMNTMLFYHFFFLTENMYLCHFATHLGK